MKTKKINRISLTALLAGSLLFSAQIRGDSFPEELVAQAKEFVDLLAKGEFAKAVENFDSVMTKAMPEEKLEEVWQAVMQQAGPFKKQKGTRTETLPKFDVVYVICEFEKNRSQGSGLLRLRRNTQLLIMSNRAPSMRKKSWSEAENGLFPAP